ncbi:MAG: HlyD family type I secretion periplasmic adaptor subunit [Magnetococcales bacterium]|nr:HlyD family type I secretion periplasmic adaptor subunit [Magnetococcales bacterium]
MRERGTHLFLALCLAGVIAFGVWAVVGSIDVVSLAVGEVIPSSQVKNLQHLEGGIVREVRVREGETVREGQELVILEPVRSEADYEELRAHIVSLTIQAIRLRAETALPDTEETAPPDPPDELTRQAPTEVAEMRAYFETRQKRLREQRAIQREVNTQREQEIQEARAQAQGGRELLKHLNEQIAISEQLLQKDLSNRMKHMEYLKDAARTRSIIAENEARQARLQAALREGEKRLAALRTGFLEEAGKELASVTGALQELRHRRDRLEDALRRTVLRAPVAGVVKNVFVHTVGEVIPPGGTVLELVPSDDPLVIQAQLPIQEIGFVLAGQKALIRLEGPGSATFDTLTGTVIHVSPDSLVDKKGIPYYLARIRPDRDHFFSSRRMVRHPLLPGMRVRCAIVTGSRTILEALVGPLRRSMDNAMRER